MTRKTNFFEERSWFKFNNLGPVQGMILKFYSIVEKKLKLIVRKFWGLIPMFEQVARETLVGGAFLVPSLFPLPPFSWIGLKKEISQYMGNEVLTTRHLNNRLRSSCKYLPRKSRFGFPFKVCSWNQKKCDKIKGAFVVWYWHVD